MSSILTNTVTLDTGPDTIDLGDALIYRRPHSPNGVPLSVDPSLPPLASVATVATVPANPANPTLATPAARRRQATQREAEASRVLEVPVRPKPVPSSVMHPSRVPKMLPPVGIAGFFSVNPWATPVCTALAVLVPLGMGAAALTATVLFWLLPMEIPGVVLFSACAAGSMAAVIAAYLVGRVVWQQLQGMVLLHDGREG